MCKRLQNCFFKLPKKTDEAALKQAGRASEKASRLLKTYGKTLTEILIMAEDAENPRTFHQLSIG